MMKGLNLYSLCTKVSHITSQRSLHSGYILLARQKRTAVQYTKREPGIQNQKELFSDIDIPGTETDADDFLLSETVDVENIDTAYDENEREKRDYRNMVERSITYKKYFAPPPQPAMLTCNEIECIKYLHQNDPLNWNVRALSESFPATPEIIKKVLKNRVKLTPERAKKKDEAVYKNWELLAEGKLEADPKVIEHCKKFINRREVLLGQIKNTKFYLPEVKEEPTYNAGEMSNILVHYEKRLTELQKDRDSKMGSEPEKKGEKYLEILHKEVEKVMSKRIQKKESDVLKKVVNTYKKEITFDELEKNTIQRVERNKKTDLAEKAILESKFGTSKQYTVPLKDKMEKVEPKIIPKKLLTKETSVKFQEESGDFKLKSYDDDLPDLPSPDERTLFSKESDIGQLLNKIKNPVVQEMEKTDDTNVFPDREKITKENEYFDAQVEDIKNTPFWNSNLRSKEKAELELQKEPMRTPTECKRIVKSDVHVPDNYPLRIPIPKSKRGSGLTFRVNDCFYDDDGEFLYRVPGMLPGKINS